MNALQGHLVIKLLAFTAVLLASWNALVLAARTGSALAYGPAAVFCAGLVWWGVTRDDAARKRQAPWVLGFAVLMTVALGLTHLSL